MSEIEKLRALLAEARIITQDSLDSNTTGFDEEFKVCHCDSCERYRSIIQRIDAALAEPVRGCESCGDKTYREVLDDNVRVRAERDEARAQIEQMNLEAADVRRLARSMAEDAFRKRDEAQERAEERNDEANRLQRYLNMAAKERDEARAEVEKLRRALELSEVDVALERTWCRICRTENRSGARSREAHPHEARCVLACQGTKP